jgi:2-polyprenyl-3-methyl-5-hydroxy-6-metoxy-1,4-benzoquinol methylase
MSEADDAARDRNRDAWNARRYEAWVGAYGPPEAEARVIVADPAKKLRRLLPHMGEVAGQRVCNMQGSHGRVAVALALIGADATVIDFAEENRRYALQLAAAAGVTIDYRVADAMEADTLGLAPFDWVAMELGILHYHQDLVGFFRVMARLAKPGGRLVLNEFHPVNRKLRQAGVPADYFNAEVMIGDVPNPTGDGTRLGQCAFRAWTLGEIVTATIDAGWVVEKLLEHPDWVDEPTWPGTFTLLAGKPD